MRQLSWDQSLSGDPSSRRPRAIAAKSDPGHRSTLGRGRRRQAIFGSIRSQLQVKIVTIFAADNPTDDSEELEGGFPSGFPHNAVDLGPPHLIAIIPTAGGEHRRPRLSRGSQPHGG